MRSRFLNLRGPKGIDRAGLVVVYNLTETMPRFFWGYYYFTFSRPPGGLGMA